MDENEPRRRGINIGEKRQEDVVQAKKRSKGSTQSRADKTALTLLNVEGKRSLCGLVRGCGEV